MRKVLLIDDDPVQLSVREKVLRGAGMEVDVATNADSALALARSGPGNDIGVVLTDHIMPGVSGAEFVRRLRQVNPSVPVVVITGMPEADQEYAGLDVHFRPKPFPPVELIALVRRLLAAA